VPQVGVAGYFIDLAVKHPKRSGYLLGIECDGAMYHSSKSARDRDRLREEVLIGLKWNIYRIWSTDWFADPQQQFNRLVAHIEQLLAQTPDTQ
jgi:very-short-patch-repair endonuclease